MGTSKSLPAIRKLVYTLLVNTKFRFLAVAILLQSAMAPNSWAGPREKGKLLFERIAGIPPSAALLDQLEATIKGGNITAAAQIAMAQPSFYNLTLKNWVTPWTNASRSIQSPLNDYSATVIGMIRDDLPFDEILYGDHLYVAPQALVAAGTTRAFNRQNNDMYADLENKAIDLSQAANLARVSQTATTGIADTAGVITTRASGAAFFSAGTNRRVFRFIAINHLCNDLEALQDTSVPDFRVRRDVDRSPGGDSRTFKNKCVGCHGLQDALGGAFAYFNFNNNQLEHTPGNVQGKMNQNREIFPEGFNTTNDSWLNLITTGRNASLGWRKPSSGSVEGGNGARSLGATLAATRAFSSCAVEKVFTKVCLRSPTVSERASLENLTDRFEQGGYKIKTVFAEVGQFCLGL